MSMIRHVPVRYESDFWRPLSSSSMQSQFPSSSMQSQFPSSFRSHFQPSHLPPMQLVSDFPTTAPVMMQQTSPLLSSQSSHLDTELRRMHEEMSRMFENVQHRQPVGTVDDWRLTENFRMENPIITERDGSRKFKLTFDVRQFRPEEINVKTSGNTLTVHAKQEEKDPSKSMFCEFHRQFTIPKEVVPESLVSKLSSAGVLTIEAPLPALEGPRDKMIPIEHNRI